MDLALRGGCSPGEEERCVTNSNPRQKVTRESPSSKGTGEGSGVRRRDAHFQPGGQDGFQKRLNGNWARSLGVLNRGQALTCQVRAVSAVCGPRVLGTLSCQASPRPATYISNVQPPIFPKTYVPVFISPGHTAQSQIGSKQIYGYLLDVFEIHKSFHHRKADLTSIFCEALLALAHSPLDVSLPPSSANSSENESTDPVCAHCLDQSGPSQTAKGSFSKRRQDSPFPVVPTWPLGGRYQTDPLPACPYAHSVGSPTQPSKTSHAFCGHPDTRGP